MSLAHLNKPAVELDGFSLYFTVEHMAVIVMDRGENRLNDKFMRDYNRLLDAAEQNEDCIGLITTGVGKFFSNGIDLKWIAEQERLEVRRFFTNIWRLLKRLLLFPLPSIAAINGHCFAGGAFLALAHDMRAMKDEGRGWLCFNEVHGGMQFAPPMLVFLRNIVGPGATLHKALALGHRFTAPEAREANLVTFLTSESLLVKEAARAVKRSHLSTGIPRESLTAMKGDLYQDLITIFNTEIADFESNIETENPGLDNFSKKIKSNL